MKRLFRRLTVFVLSVALSFSALPAAYAEERPQFFPEYIVLTEAEEAEFQMKLQARNVQIQKKSASAGNTAKKKSKYNTSTDYLYKQLKNDDEKAFYKDIVNALENFYWGEEEPIQIGDKYYLGSVSFADYNIDLERAFQIQEMVENSNPKYFFVKTTYTGSAFDGNAGEKYIRLRVCEDQAKRSVINSYRDKIESITDKWVSEIEKKPNDLQKELAVVAKLSDHITSGYMDRLDENGDPVPDVTRPGQYQTSWNSQTIAGALIDKKCVCSGYANATQYLLNALGIETLYICSTKDQDGAGHAYNIVKLYGKWYCLDVTWLDPNKTDGSKDSENYHNAQYYLNKSNKTFSEEGQPGKVNIFHTYNTQKYTEEWKVELPTCTGDEVIDKSRSVKVSFKSGDKTIRTQKVKWGEKAKKPASPKKTGYRFGGWYKDSKYTKFWNFDEDHVYKNSTVYARFTKILDSDAGMTIKEGVLTGYDGTATTFVIPADVHTIENKTAINIYSNEKYKVAKGNNRFRAVDGVLFSKDNKTLVAYPRNKKGKSYKVPAKTTTIGSFAFCANRNIEKLTLPKGLKTIESIAFYNSNLKRVNIPKSVTYIGTQAFSKTKIKDITIDSQITSLEYELFADCSELESVVLPASLTSMSTDVFKNCKSLKDIYFGGTKEQWDAIDKTAAALPTVVTIHYGK